MIGIPRRVGIIGCGRIAGGWDDPQPQGPITTHAQAYHRHPRFELVAAVDPDEGALTRFRRAWGVPQWYRSIEDMQNVDALDVVSICSPDELHFVQASYLLAQHTKPRVLLIEKPVCLSADELARLAELTRESGVEVMVNHTRRFDPSHRSLAKLIRSGALGRFLQGRCTYYGGWIHNGTHCVDTIRMLFGEEPRVVSAAVSGHVKPSDPDLRVSLEVARSTINIEAFDSRYYQLFDSEFRFEQGRVRLLDFGRTIVVEHVQVNEIGERVLETSEDWPQPGLTSPMCRVVDAIDAHLDGERVLHQLDVGLPSAARTMEVIWRARELALDKTAQACIIDEG